MKDGTLVARQARVVMDTGAYSYFGPAATSYATSYAMGPYNIPNMKADGYCVYTNKHACGAMRAPGAAQAAFAVESHTDKMAHALGLDPLDLRLKNAVGDGDASPTGQVFEEIGFKNVLGELRDFLARQGPPGPGRAWGVACGQWGVGGTSSSAQIKINEDGTAVLFTGSVDVGQGSDTVLCQIAAEELGLDLKDMSIVTGDTDATPFDMATVANRTTFTMGTAVRIAAGDARQQVLERASQLLEANPRDLETAERKVRVKGSPERAVPIAQIAAMSHARVGPILGRGSYVPPSPPYDPRQVQGHAFPSKPGENFTAQAALVEVDQETGGVTVLQMASIHDLGFAVNPQLAEGQVEGGMSFGLGYALSEGVVFQGGKALNETFQDYRLFTAEDLPAVQPIFVEEPKGDGPYGAKSLGEPPNTPTAPAVANAIYNAAGIRLQELPITPEKVRKALREKEGRRGAGPDG